MPEKDETHDQMKGRTTRSIVEHIIEPLTRDSRCRFFEAPAVLSLSLGGAGGTKGDTRCDTKGGASNDGWACASEAGWCGPATFFVSHAWEDDWREKVEAICEHSARHWAQHRSRAFYWIDVFAICQWPGPERDADLPPEPMPAKQLEPPSSDQTCAGGFAAAIRAASGGLLALMLRWDDPALIKRVWCLYEVLLSSTRDVPITVGLSSAARRRCRAALAAGELSAIFAPVEGIDFATATASVAKDRESILAALCALDMLPSRVDGLKASLCDGLLATR
eukprot:SAG31_NODE_1305_length_8893_cov_7.391176_1_plen_279_part_00